MKVIFIDPQSYNVLGKYDISLLQKVVKPGIQVKFFCNVRILEEKYFESLNFCSIEPVFSYGQISNIFAKIFSYLFSYGKIILYLIAEPPDIIHIQWMRIPLFDILFIGSLRLLRIPVIYTSHNFLPHRQNFFSFFFSKAACRLATRVVVHSKSTKDLLVSQFGCKPENILTIPYGKLNPVSSPLKTTVYNTAKGTPYCPLVFSILGTIRVDKGILEYLQVWSYAWHNYKDTLSQAKLRIVGEWESGYFDKVNDFIIDNCLTNVSISNRWLSNQDFEQEIINADVCVLPYLSMSQSGLLMTLLSYEKPCIVSNVGGLPEPFEVARVGWVFLWEEDLEITIEKAIFKPIQEISSGWLPSSEDWEAIDRHFSWSRAGEATTSLYKHLSDQ
jgi:glycosyltransferase involved in cell wall biosynthesis